MVFFNLCKLWPLQTSRVCLIILYPKTYFPGVFNILPSQVFCLDGNTLGITLEFPTDTQLTSFVTKSNTPSFLRQRPEKFFEDKLDQSMFLFEVLLWAGVPSRLYRTTQTPGV